jgi:hypothetical protein
VFVTKILQTLLSAGLLGIGSHQRETMKMGQIPPTVAPIVIVTIVTPHVAQKIVDVRFVKTSIHAAIM